jgi:hypothetical protein
VGKVICEVSSDTERRKEAIALRSSFVLLTLLNVQTVTINNPFSPLGIAKLVVMVCNLLRINLWIARVLSNADIVISIRWDEICG